MSMPERSRDRVGSIPSLQPTMDQATTMQSHMEESYRRSSLPSSNSPTQPFTKNEPLLPLCNDSSLSLPTDSEKEDEQDNSYPTSSATSRPSSSSSNSSTHEKQAASDNMMVSVESLGHSSSIAGLAIPFDEAPALPAKSSLRTARLLATIPQKRLVSEEQPMLPHAAPHQMYLSSEEDPSSSADDFSDFDDDMEWECKQSQKPAQGSIIRSDTARAVAVVFSGRPSMITLSPRRSISPSSSDSRHVGSSLLRTATEPALSRRRSVSSNISLLPSLRPPPRSSSMLTAGMEKKRPHFLQFDPFAKVTEEPREPTTPRSPMTPTGMLRKTLSLVKKRSKPNLHQSDSNMSPMEQVGEMEETEDPRESICMEPAQRHRASFSYHEMVRSSKRHGPASIPRSETPSQMSPKNRLRTGLGLGRRGSVKV